MYPLRKLRSLLPGICWPLYGVLLLPLALASRLLRPRVIGRLALLGLLRLSLEHRARQLIEGDAQRLRELPARQRLRRTGTRRRLVGGAGRGKSLKGSPHRDCPFPL